MRHSITTIAALHTSLEALGRFEGGVESNKTDGPAERAAIALYSWNLSVEERGRAYNLVVKTIANLPGYRLTTYQSQREAKAGKTPLGFKPQTWSQTSKAGVAASVALAKATAPLKFTTYEAAKKYADRITAPRVERVASSKDKAIALAQRYLKMSPAQKRWFLDAIK